MFNPEIVLPSPQSQPTAPYPTASKARVQLQGTIYQSYGHCDILAELTEHAQANASESADP